MTIRYLFPFDVSLCSVLYYWKTPIGFLWMAFKQTFWSYLVLELIISAFFFFMSMCSCLIDCSQDINTTLKILNSAAVNVDLEKNRSARIEFKQKFNGIIEFHATSKQLVIFGFFSYFESSRQFWIDQINSAFIFSDLPRGFQAFTMILSYWQYRTVQWIFA